MGLNISLIHTDDETAALGIRCISATLNEAGHRTKKLMLGSKEKLYNEATLDAIKKLVSDSDVIGFSCFTRSSDKVKQLAQFLRPLNKKLVWGGLYATLNPEDCVSFVDVVCRGEGEGFVLDFVDTIEKNGEWKNILNAAYSNQGVYTVNPLRPTIENLDDLPLPDYNRSNEYHLIGPKLAPPRMTAFELVEPLIFTGSRGCHFYCNYCSNAKLKEMYKGNGRYGRKMSIDTFVAHAEKLKRMFPHTTSFFFADEDFLARNIDDFKRFAEIYPQRVGLPFWCMGSPRQMTQEKMDLLVKAGIYRIDFGVESGSERTKKEIFNRHISNQVVQQSAHVVNHYPQVIVYYFIIIGNPYEHEEDILQTINLVKGLPSPFILRTYNLIFFPGTILYEMALRDGIIEGKKDCGYEMDFLSGLRFEGLSWKSNNLYLNGLLFLMAGKSSKFSMSLVPRFLISFLTKPSVIKFNERHQFILRTVIQIRRAYLPLRKFGGFVIRIVRYVLKICFRFFGKKSK